MLINKSDALLSTACKAQALWCYSNCTQRAGQRKLLRLREENDLFKVTQSEWQPQGECQGQFCELALMGRGSLLPLLL